MIPHSSPEFRLVECSPEILAHMWPEKSGYLQIPNKNQLEKNMEDEMDTVIIVWFIGSR